MPNVRKCKNKECPEYFKPDTVMDYPRQEWCSPECKTEIALQFYRKQQERREKTVRKAQKAEKKYNRKARLALNGDKLSHQHELTQKVFNSLILLIDKDEGCKSCGKPVCGYIFDCGHVKSRKSHPELRYDFLNAYKQGSGCNRGQIRFNSRDEVVSKKYEQALGEEVMAYLNGPHQAKHYTREGLKEMRAEFAAEIRYIEKHGKPSRDWRAL